MLTILCFLWAHWGCNVLWLQIQGFYDTESQGAAQAGAIIFCLKLIGSWTRLAKSVKFTDW